jgi:hypothetical protein
MPGYWNYPEQHLGFVAYASIILVLRPPRGAPFGFLNLEFDTHLSFQKRAQVELRALADAIGTLENLFRSRDHRIDRMTSELRHLNARSDRGVYWFPLERVKLFFAYPKSTDKEVLDVVRSVLKEFEDVIERVDWSEDMHDPGDVIKQIDARIMESTFGVCIFSEQKGRTSYQDNPNVLIEAGMMHAYEITVTSPMIGWIPVREGGSSQIPFDFVTQRTIWIPRRSNGKLNKQEFRDTLKTRLTRLITRA